MIASVQTDLELSVHRHTSRVISILRQADDWLYASDILSRLGLEDCDSNRRIVRAVAEELGSDLITGQKGYRHIDNASEEEVRHFANWMLSQANKMTVRARAALSRRSAWCRTRGPVGIASTLPHETPAASVNL